MRAAPITNCALLANSARANGQARAVHANVAAFRSNANCAGNMICFKKLVGKLSHELPGPAPGSTDRGGGGVLQGGGNFSFIFLLATSETEGIFIL